MKEVTEWDNNPRNMYVWDTTERERRISKVFFITEDEEIVVYAEFTAYGLQK